MTEKNSAVTFEVKNGKIGPAPTIGLFSEKLGFAFSIFIFDSETKVTIRSTWLMSEDELFIWEGAIDFIKEK